MSYDAARAAELADDIRAQMRPGGSPTKLYRERNAHDVLNPEVGADISAEIIQNLEERLVALERQANP